MHHFFCILTLAFLLLASSPPTPSSFAATAAASKRWTPETSEEHGDHSPAVCAKAAVSGISCAGPHCDNIALQCAGGFTNTEDEWTDYFSEEGKSERICPDNGYVTGLRCKGRYCDNISLRCSWGAELESRSCYWTAPISEEYGAKFQFPADARLTGLRCAGRYCSRLSMRLCQTQPPQFCQDEACYEKLARTFAPLLRFDQLQGKKNKCFPSSADEYYAARKSGSKARICNTDYESIQEGQVPVYYHYQSCGSNEVTILYWFFYGYQDTCSPGLGAHDADWERIAVKIKDGRLQKVKFFQHAGSYTRTPGHFQVFDQTHPVIYVGKNSHGSYHDHGGSGSCLYFEDFRNPSGHNQKMETWKNLVLLKDDPSSPEWMIYKGTDVWNKLSSPLARNINFCELPSCVGKSFNMGKALCFGQCGCLKSNGGDLPF